MDSRGLPPGKRRNKPHGIDRIQLAMRPYGRFPLMKLRLNVYAIETESGTVLFDCGPEETASTLESVLKNGPVLRVYLTHGHADHAGSCQYWMNRGARIFAPGTEFTMLRKGGAENAPKAFQYRGFEPRASIRPGDIISIDDLQFAVLPTPGHTEGSVCYLEARKNILICGDLLFGPFGGYSVTLLLQILTAMVQPKDELLRHIRSLERLVNAGVITDSTFILPGHGPGFYLKDRPKTLRRTMRVLRFCSLAGNKHGYGG